jgi:hypothetical protein
MPVTHGDERGRCRSFDEPLPTATGAHRAGPQPAGASRGELACIIAAFGERQGQAPRIHSVDEPAPTICAQGRVQLAAPIVEGNTTSACACSSQNNSPARWASWTRRRGIRIRRQQDRNHQADRQCRSGQSCRRTGWRLDAELKSAVAYGRLPSSDGSNEAAPDQNPRSTQQRTGESRAAPRPAAGRQSSLRRSHGE